MALYKTNKAGLNSQILCESEDLFLNGTIINVDEVPAYTEIDYRNGYNTKFKKISEMYLPEEDDELISINEKDVMIKNDKTQTIKYVLTEDFLVKDIRSKLNQLA